jgi:putative ABC transport system permease protein
MLASTPLPDAPGLDQLGKGGRDGIPVLVRGSLHPGLSLRLYLEDDQDSGASGGYSTAENAIKLTAVGTAPAIDGMDDVVVIDAAALPGTPDTIWATGPGAARAIDAVAASGHPVVRDAVLAARRSAPLTAGLRALDLAAAGTLLVLGMLGFALGAAAGAPARWRTLARLRTLGLRTRDTRRVAAGELLPPVLVAAVSGPLLGVLLVRLTFGPLSLRLITTQSADPPAVVPWWLLGVASIVLLLTLVAVVVAEAAVRRRRGLGDVLRAGGD